MGNRESEQRGYDSPRRGFGFEFSNEEDDRRGRRSSSSNRRRDRKSGSRFSKRGKKSRKEERDDPFDKFNDIMDFGFGQRGKKSRKEERDDPFDMFNDIMDFGFGQGPDRMGFGFGEDMTRMIREAGTSGGHNGAFSSHMFSSVTTTGEDGIPVTESRGVSQNSNGRYKMAHQRRIGDRSQTRMREKQHENAAFHEFQKLHQISHDDLPRFTTEFKERTKEWNSYRAIKDKKKPYLELEDGRRSRETVYPPSYTRPITDRNHHRRSDDFYYKPRGIEY